MRASTLAPKDITISAIHAFGRALGYDSDKIATDFNENLDNHYYLLAKYIKRFINLKHDINQINSEFVDVIMEYGNNVENIIQYSATPTEKTKRSKKKSSLEPSLFFAKLSEACLFGILERLPTSPLSYEDFKSLYMNHVLRYLNPDFFKISNFLKEIPENVEMILTNESVTIEDVRKFIRGLLRVLREHITFKNQNPTDQKSNQIDQYVNEIKNLINHMAIILKNKSKNNKSKGNLFNAVGEEIQADFNRYIRSLFREEVGLGLQKTEDENEQRKQDIFAILGNRYTNKLTSFTNRILEEKPRSWASKEEFIPWNCEELLKGLNDIIEQVSKRIPEIQATKKTQLHVKANDLLEGLVKIRNDIENEWITFHTKDNSHTGKYGFKNILLDKPTKEVTKNIEFAKKIAKRQLATDMKKVAGVQNKVLKQTFSTTVKEGFTGLVVVQEDSSHGSLGESKRKLNSLRNKNNKISSSKDDDKTLKLVNKYIDKCYTAISGDRAIAIDSDIEDRAKHFNAALNDYRMVLKKHHQATVLISMDTSSPTNTKATQNYLIESYCKERNVELSRYMQIQLDSAGMLLRDKLSLRFANGELNQPLKIIFKNLENCRSTQDHLNILNKLVGAYRSLLDSKICSWHREYIKEAVISIIRRQILTSEKFPIQFPVKRKDLLTTKALISWMKSNEGDNKDVNEVIQLLDKDICNKKLVEYEDLLLDSNVVNSEFKDLLLRQTINDNQKNRVQRFGKALADKLTNASLATYVLASGDVVAKNGLLSSGAIGLAAALQFVSDLPVAAPIKAGAEFVNQKYTENASTHASSRMANPVDWMNYVWEELVPELMEIFSDVVSKMQGGEDVERFADFCQKRIMNQLQNGDLPDSHEERIVYMVKAILMNRIPSSTPCIPQYYLADNDQSWFFMEHCFEKIATNCTVTYKTDDSHKAKTWSFYPYDHNRKNYGALFFRNEKLAENAAKELFFHEPKRPKIKL